MRALKKAKMLKTLTNKNAVATYNYIGPEDLLELITDDVDNTCLKQPSDVLKWIKITGQELDSNKSITATYIVDSDKLMWIGDRHMEHVVCAKGNSILAAGEITFTINQKEIYVSSITNQSTGFCPKPECWKQVTISLNKAKIEHPDNFTIAFEFRRCDSCNTLNLIKDNFYYCSVCDSELPKKWNIENIN